MKSIEIAIESTMPLVQKKGERLEVSGINVIIKDVIWKIQVIDGATFIKAMVYYFD